MVKTMDGGRRTVLTGITRLVAMAAFAAILEAILTSCSVMRGQLMVRV